MLETFTLAIFTPHVGDVFHLHIGAGEVLDARLLQATSLSAKGPSGEPVPRPRTPFSLVFRVPARFRFVQQIYKLEHPALGAFEVFMVPIGLDAEGYRCEVIFT
jgi:hypothetical protein